MYEAVDENGDGIPEGWYYTGPDGIRQYIPDPGAGTSVQSAQPVSSYPAGTPISDLGALPAGNALVRDANNTVIQDEQGNYYYTEGEGDATYSEPGAGLNLGIGTGVVAAPTYPTIQPQAPEVIESGVSGSGYDDGYSRGYSYNRRGYGGGYGSGSSGGGYSSGGGSYERSYPTYQDGSTHPAWGGQPRTPGGFWNDGTGTGQQQVYVPGGAAAGPYSTRAASNPYAGRGGYSGGGGGGGGSSLYNAWRDKLTAKLYPGSGSGYSGGSSYSPYPEAKEPRDPRMRGAAKGFDPDQASALYARPTSMIPRVAPNLGTASPLYEMASSAPAYQLALLGTGNKRATPRNSLSNYVGGLENVYSGMINKGAYPDFNQLTNQLTSAKRNSALGQLVKPKPDAYGNYYESPLGQAQSVMSSLIGAVGSTLDDRAAAAYQRTGEGLIDKYGAKFIKKDPKKMPMITKWVGRKLY
jgi:hypothetical protein